MSVVCAGRIGASISRGAGLNDILVARDLLDYEELGVRLGTPRGPIRI